MWPQIIATGISGLLGGFIGKPNKPDLQNYQPDNDNTGTYIVIAALIIVLIILALIIKKSR